jgi:hypothetical protein
MVIRKELKGDGYALFEFTVKSVSVPLNRSSRTNGRVVVSTKEQLGNVVVTCIISEYTEVTEGHPKYRPHSKSPTTCCAPLLQRIT